MTQEDKIRKRVSYNTFVGMSRAFRKGEAATLEFLDQELNRRSAYGSERAAVYAEESLEQFKKDNKL